MKVRDEYTDYEGRHFVEYEHGPEATQWEPDEKGQTLEAFQEVGRLRFHHPLVWRGFKWIIPAHFAYYGEFPPPYEAAHSEIHIPIPEEFPFFAGGLSIPEGPAIRYHTYRWEKVYLWRKGGDEANNEQYTIYLWPIWRLKSDV